MPEPTELQKLKQKERELKELRARMQTTINGAYDVIDSASVSLDAANNQLVIVQAQIRELRMLDLPKYPTEIAIDGFRVVSSANGNKISPEVKRI